MPYAVYSGMRNTDYEKDDQTFSATAYRVNAVAKGVAFWVLGWETEADEDTEWTGIKNRTGRVVVRMVGDDRNFTCDHEDVHPLADDDFCGGCGQIGCRCYQ